MSTVGTLLWSLLALVLTEIGANPTGPESGAGSPGDRFEFVELWNETPETLDLSGLLLDDGDEADSLVAWTDSTLLNRFPGLLLGTLHLPPGAYALILDPEATDSLEGFPWPPPPPGTLVLRPQDTDLGNGLAITDPVGIRRGSQWLSTYGRGTAWADTALLDPREGISVERRDPLGPDSPDNFRLSRWQASPGRRNSWSLDQNLALLYETLRWQPAFPAPGETLQVRVTLQNLGLQPHESPLTLTLGDKTLSILVSLAPDSTRACTLRSVAPPEGVWPLELALAPDEEPTNDTLHSVLVVDLGPVVVNEIQYQDTVEWVELHNPTDTLISLQGWFLQDASGHTSAPLSGTLPPGGYRVLTASPSFATLWPGVPHTVLAPWPTLNNAGDTLYLCDSLGHAWDAVPYEASWGGTATHSLERISPFKAARFSWNWQTCPAAAGGTPGARNAAFLPPDTAQENPVVIVHPEVRPGETVVLRYQLSSPARRLELLIFDGTGHQQGPALRADTPGTSGALHWTAPRVPGLYLVLFRAHTAGGLRTYKTTFVVTP